MSADLKYKLTRELRQDIVYSVGCDPTRYDEDNQRHLIKSEVVRVARELQPDSNDDRIDQMTKSELLPRICDWAGGGYHENAGFQDGIRRENLKLIHRAINADEPHAVVEP